jgi:uncharacterized protein DUF2824
VIRLERTHDLALVAAITTHPALWRHVSNDDSGRAEDFWPKEAAWHVLAYDGAELLGVFIAYPITSLLWGMHHCLLPVSWGRSARAAGKAFFAWLWAHSEAEQVLGFVPANNRLAVQYARGLGAKETGRIARCYRSAGVRLDLILFTKEK